VANDQLRGISLEDRAHVIQWMNYGDTNVASAVASWVYPALGLVESTNQHVHKAKEDLKRVFTFLNDQLKTRTYLVGERVTLADISLAIDLLLAYQHVADDKFRHPYTNLNRWFTTIINQPNFKAVVGEVKMCGQPIEYDRMLLFKLKYFLNFFI
jgi:elongation factor 1-gamma